MINKKWYDTQCVHIRGYVPVGSNRKKHSHVGNPERFDLRCDCRSWSIHRHHLGVHLAGRNPSEFGTHLLAVRFASSDRAACAAGLVHGSGVAQAAQETWT